MWLVLLTLVVVVLILMWLIRYLPGEWQMPAQVIVAVIAIVYLLQVLGVFDIGLPVYTVRQ